MPTFVYLPERVAWICLSSIAFVADEDGKLAVWFVGDDGEHPSLNPTGKDRDVLLKALSKLTPKELT